MEKIYTYIGKIFVGCVLLAFFTFVGVSSFLKWDKQQDFKYEQMMKEYNQIDEEIAKRNK